MRGRSLLQHTAAIVGAVTLSVGLVGAGALPAAAATPGATDEQTADAAVAAVLAEPGESGVPVTMNGITITPFYCDAETPTHTYTVPDDVHSLYVEAVGGEGQTPDPSTTGLGGLAGQVTGVLNVLPQDVFQVQVGCAGTSDGGASAYAKGGAKGTGWSHLNDFATVYSFGYDGGGGGGASAVLDMQDNGAEVAVAGGGGGAGGDAPNCLEGTAKDDYLFFFYCGPGYSAPQQGGDGGDGAGPDSFGGGGENNSSGQAPDGVGCDGPAAGGRGENFDKTGGGGAGGGGGGGFVSGGGGGGCGGYAGQATQIDSPTNKVAHGSAGSGGGGGASYSGPALNQSNIAVAEDSGDGYVLFLTAADGVKTVPFSFTGSYEAYCVPDGVDEMFVEVLGGAGGGGGSDFPDRTGVGGGGGGVQAVIPVVERTLLQIGVGQYGHASGGWGDGRGGHRGTSGSEGDGAGGGGSSAVKQSTSECVEHPDAEHLPGLSYLAVGAGGGGGGGYATTADGGDGGDAGSPGDDGSVGGDPDGGAAGCGGTASADGGCESGVHGGHGTSATDGGGGGGGGGGYLAGGEGHGAQDGRLGGGGGGGGGNSYATDVLREPVRFFTGPRGDRSNHDRVNEGHVNLIIPVPSTRSAVTILGGNQQTANPGEAFADPLSIEFVDAIHGPTANTEVTLTIAEVDGRAPAAFAGGASSITVTTDGNGRANAPLTAASGQPVGQFSVTARVTDDPGNQIKAAQFTLFAVGYPTTLALDSDATALGAGGAATEGERLTFTATTTRAAAAAARALEGEPVERGAVQFSIDGVALGAPVPVGATGVATSPVWTADLGQHQVLATYIDDPGGDNATTFSSYSVRVSAPETSVTSLTSSMPDGLYGDESVTFPVAVTAVGTGIWNPSGTVQLYRGTVPLGEPIVLDANGVGVSESFSARAFALGENEITAEYSGDDHVEASASGVVDLLVIDFGARPRDDGSPSGGEPGRTGTSRGNGLAATGGGLVGLPLAVLALGVGGALVLLRRRLRS